MLNDKHTETAEIVGDMQRYAKQLREFDVDEALAKLDEVTSNISVVEKVIENNEWKTAISNISATSNIEETEIEQNEKTESDNKFDALTKNEKILVLHQEGMNEVEIAKKLDCGLGEVRLVLGLYHET